MELAPNSAQLQLPTARSPSLLLIRLYHHPPVKVLSTFSKPVWSLDRSCSGLEALWSFEKPIANTKTVLLRISAGMDPPGPLDSKLGALVKHHYLSWIFILVLVGIEIAAQLITPYKRYVSQYMFVTGELKYPLKSNTVPFQAVPVIALVIPLIFVLGLNFWRRSIRDTHHAVLGLFTAVLLTAAITDSVKDGIGRPRPDFYARCFGSVNGTALYDVTGNVICTGSTAVMREAYKSFPSGHTSWSFAGMGYLSMYLAGKLGIFDKKGHSWKLLPVILPLLLAIFVGVTRIDDYWHHWTDVFAGALLGLSAAYFCYRQHFPSLYDEFASQPYAIVVGTRIFHNTTLAGTHSDVPLQSDMSTYNDVERGS